MSRASGEVVDKETQEDVVADLHTGGLVLYGFPLERSGTGNSAAELSDCADLLRVALLTPAKHGEGTRKIALNNSTLVIRLSRITAYLEVKIWSLPIHENLTTDGKYCRKEEKLLLRSNFSFFSTIFSIYL